MEKYEVMYSKDCPLCRQSKDGIMYIAGDVEDSFYCSRPPLKIDQVEEYVKDAPAGKGQNYVIDTDVIEQ